MGLLDTLARQVGGSLLSGAMQPTFLAGLLDQAGGLNGLAKRFEDAGLGAIYQSWVSAGDNQRIEPAQLLQALGEERLVALANQVGLDRTMVLSAMAQLLPSVIDQLTPDGSLPAQNPQPAQLQTALQKALQQAAGAFFRRSGSTPT
jgi:uncharacterized protein YidB (DUF937 family)